MKIIVDGSKAKIFTPYSAEFVYKIKQIGGAKWSRKDTCWKIPAEAVDAVRAIMQDVYGYSDISENDTIKLKITVNKELRKCCSDIVIFGKIVSHASGRDSGARVGDDVAYIKGGAQSGGSRKYWESIVEEGSVIILNNVNKNIYETRKPTYDLTVEVMDEVINKEKLLAEKTRLLARIEEIDKLLNE